MKIHELKTKPEYFEAARKRQKNFEILRDCPEYGLAEGYCIIGF